MRYNAYIRYKLGTYTILQMTEQELDTLVEAIELRAESCTIKGKRMPLTHLIESTFYESAFGPEVDEASAFEHFRREGFINSMFGLGGFVAKEGLLKVGKEITDKYLKPKIQGRDKNGEGNESYVNLERIENLRKLKGKFDYSRLVSLLEELNLAYKNKMWITTIILVRTIIDHVPEIFGKPNFGGVVGGAGSRSFQQTMKVLEESARKIADSNIHIQIRYRESLPNETQVNFSRELDMLLEEIIRINPQ